MPSPGLSNDIGKQGHNRGLLMESTGITNRPEQADERQRHGRRSFGAVVSNENDIFGNHADGKSRLLALRSLGLSGPCPASGAAVTRAIAHQSAEWTNSQVRQAPMEMDRRLDAALAFTGRPE